MNIAYIGGGSRGWAWGLMGDLAHAEDISGSVRLYDIDFDAAKRNEVIGNRLKENGGGTSEWNYTAVKKIEDALCGADFVVISILPGTFDEMESDVHAPEKYGIYQSVGDTSGPGGILRALRTVPMFKYFAESIKKCCPNAWVINYTNPMTVCTRTLYKVFPEIKAFGCCHEVFGTQKLLAAVIDDILGIKDVDREEIKVNVVGVNHFTWLTSAQYKNIDLFPVYKEFVKKYKDTGFSKQVDNNWMNNSFTSDEMVKMDLFDKFGAIAAAGDRHLAEFCPGNWYLKDKETVKRWHFGLTTVDWRREDLQKRLDRSQKLYSGEEKFEAKRSGEEGVRQIKALLGMEDLITNVNIPNYGQIPNLPIGAVVETNAAFRANSLTPVFAGNVPEKVYPLVSRIAGEQEMIVDAALKRDLDLAYEAFISDPNMEISLDNSRKLFDEMVENTKQYLEMYF
ncbi:MAG: alpha-glucosidase/alpha-galactosidase [Firmicutes bacterium]|nr:alpha-glucosidase/alpha-galactosidase [Bacillota bacterium]